MISRAQARAFLLPGHWLWRFPGGSLRQFRHPVVGFSHNRTAPESAALADGGPVVPPHLDNRSPWPMGPCSFAAPIGDSRIRFVRVPRFPWIRRLTDPAVVVLGSGQARSDPGRT